MCCFYLLLFCSLSWWWFEKLMTMIVFIDQAEIFVLQNKWSTVYLQLRHHLWKATYNDNNEQIKEMMSSGWLNVGKTIIKNVVWCWDTTMAKERFLTQFSLLSCVCAFKRMILFRVCMCVYSCEFIFKEVTNVLYYVVEMLQENFPYISIFLIYYFFILYFFHEQNWR